MSEVRTIKCTNSTVLPVVKHDLEIETSWTLTDLRKAIKDEFEMPNQKFRVFLRAGKKWFKIEDGKTLSDYPIDHAKIQIDVKREINLDKFKEYYKEFDKHKHDGSIPYGILSVKNQSAEEARRKLISIVQEFIEDALYNPKSASFSIPSRSGDNIGFDEKSELVLLGRQTIDRAFRSLSSVKSVQQLTQLMVILDEVLARDIHMTKRDIFYNDVNTFESQGTSDGLIDDLTALLNVTRPSLNVSSSSKGIVIGHLEFDEKGDHIDCRKIGTGKAIAPSIDDIENMQSDAEFVLVIEKDAVFNRLAEDQFYDYVPSIVITAKGQPDMATRMFLKKIDEELELPILAIMDADAYGFEILRVYTVGSKSLSFEAANLAVPNIRWLGLLPSDLKEDSGFEIPSSTHIKLDKGDENKIKKMLDEEFVKRKPEWVKELKTLQDLGVKAEIQALNARDPQFITNHYLPYKLENADFI